MECLICAWLMRLKGPYKESLREYSEKRKPLVFYLAIILFLNWIWNGVTLSKWSSSSVGIPWISHEVTYKSQHHSDLPFGGGAIGFVGYDMISLYEEIGQILKIPLGLQTCILSMRTIWFWPQERKKFMS